MFEIICHRIFFKESYLKICSKASGTMKRKLGEKKKRYKVFSVILDMFYILNCIGYNSKPCMHLFIYPIILLLISINIY